MACHGLPTSMVCPLGPSGTLVILVFIFELHNCVHQALWRSHVPKTCQRSSIIQIDQQEYTIIIVCYRQMRMMMMMMMMMIMMMCYCYFIASLAYRVIRTEELLGDKAAVVLSNYFPIFSPQLLHSKHADINTVWSFQLPFFFMPPKFLSSRHNPPTFSKQVYKGCKHPQNAREGNGRTLKHLKFNPPKN